MKKIFIILSIILLQGCATTSGPSGSGLIGNNINTNYSLEDLRKANASESQPKLTDRRFALRRTTFASANAEANIAVLRQEPRDLLQPLRIK